MQTQVTRRKTVSLTCGRSAGAGSLNSLPGKIPLGLSLLLGPGASWRPRAYLDTASSTCVMARLVWR